MSNNTSIFVRFWIWLTGEVKAIPSIEHTIVTFADNLVNELKTIQSSAVVQLLEGGIIAIAEAIDPALTPLIAGIENYIPKIIGLVSGVSEEAGKSVAQQVEDGLAAIAKIKGIDGTVYAGILATLQAAISNYVLSNNAVSTNVLSPAPGTLLAVGQVVHSANAIPAAKVEAPSQAAEPKADPDMDISKEAAENLAAGSGIEDQNDSSEAEPKDESTAQEGEQQLSYDELMAKQQDQDGSQA